MRPSSLACPMRYPALPAGAFIAAFLTLIPASWIWRARHVPTLSLIVWLFALNVVYGVNSLIWSDDAIERVPIWCDICERLVFKKTGSIPNPTHPTATKLTVGGSIALPACTFRLCKQLAMVGGSVAMGLDHRDRRRIAMLDFGFCWGIPVIFMALRKSLAVSSPTMAEELTRLQDYIVQGHRYNVVQYIGCQPTIYASIPGIFIIWVPPLLLSVGSSAYAGAYFQRQFSAPISDIF